MENVLALQTLEVESLESFICFSMASTSESV
jgi:hypothetical protein